MNHTLVIAFLLWISAARLPAAETPDRSSPLFDAARAGDLPRLKALLKPGVEVDVRDAFGETPLMVAAVSADERAMELLIAAGADVNARSQAGVTPLMRAATVESKVRLLVRHHAEVKARSGLGHTPLALAARRPGNSATVAFLLGQGADVHSTNVFGTTPLVAAAAAGDLRTVRLLLDRGANPNVGPNMDQDGVLFGGGRTPLMWAAFRGNLPLLRLLLERGAKVDGFTVLGTPLSHAAWGGRVEAARLLLEAGAKVDQRDLVANYTPLHWAASAEHSDPSLAELLLAHHADPNAEGGQPVDGFLGGVQTPLTLARLRGETPVVKALLKAGARESAPQPVRRLPGLAWPSAAAAEEGTLTAAIALGVPPLQRTASESPLIF